MNILGRRIFSWWKRGSLVAAAAFTIVGFQNCAKDSGADEADFSSSSDINLEKSAALMCPAGYTYQNGICNPPAEGSSFGASFGIMYTTLHCPYAEDNKGGNKVFNTSLGQFGNLGTWNWKSRPLDGYYCVGRRADVLRKHAIQLRDAGIKFIYLDASNHPSSNPVYADRPDEMIKQPMQALLSVWSQIPGAPRVVPFVPVTNAPNPMADWMLAQLAQYPQMQLIKDGKPFFLVAANPALPIDQSHLSVLARNYSYRKMWQPNAPSFDQSAWSTTSWCSDINGFRSSAATKVCNQFVTNNNGPESVTISPAYNSYIFSTAAQATGRYGGRTFTQQFATAFKNPKIKYALIADWNSWVAIDFCMTRSGELSINPADCPNPNAHHFVDTYSDELSRDMEPTTSQGDYYYRLMKSCIAKFKRGQPCDPASANEVASVGYGSGASDAAARACSYPAESNAPWAIPGQLSGNVDGLAVENGRTLLKGWACVVGSNAATNFHVYLNGPAGSGGTFLAQFTTNQSAEAGVHAVCKNAANSPNRFSVDVTDWIAQNPGQRIYVHGINPGNGQNFLIGQSGHCAVPWPETMNATTVAKVAVVPTPTPAPVTYAMSSATSNDVIWAASGAVDGNKASVYSSNNFKNSTNSRGTYLAAWMKNGAASVSRVILTARMLNGKALGFATSYDVYLTNSANSAWNLIGNFKASPNAQGVATISLGNKYQTYGVLIIPKVLGMDDYRSYYFQLSEINLGQ